MAIKCFAFVKKVRLPCSDCNLQLPLLGGIGAGDIEKNSHSFFKLSESQ